MVAGFFVDHALGDADGVLFACGVFPHDEAEFVLVFTVFVVGATAAVGFAFVVLVFVLVQLVLLEVRIWVVWIDPAEDCRIDHNAAIYDEAYDVVLVLHVRDALLESIVHALQSDELLSSCNELFPDALITVSTQSNHQYDSPNSPRDLCDTSMDTLLNS